MTDAPIPPVLQLRVVVEADDFDAAVAFYRDALGMPELMAFADGPDDDRVAILDAGRATLELASPGHKRAIDALEAEGRESPRIRLAFEVTDAAGATRRLEGVGARARGRRARRDPVAFTELATRRARRPADHPVRGAARQPRARRPRRLRHGRRPPSAERRRRRGRASSPARRRVARAAGRSFGVAARRLVLVVQEARGGAPRWSRHRPVCCTDLPELGCRLRRRRRLLRSEVESGGTSASLAQEVPAARRTRCVAARRVALGFLSWVAPP